MTYPPALHLTARPASAPGAATVIFVHGSLDRGDSFRLAMRRLPEFATLAYDRRGYQGSRNGGVVGLGGHVEDLLAVAETVRAAAGGGRDGGDVGGGGMGDDGGPVVAIGHSLGGDVVIGAALASPGAFDAIGAFEPPMPWLGFRRQGGTGTPWPGLADDPGEEAERFFKRMVSEGAWERLTERRRDERRADGPALVADLRGMRVEGPPFDVTALAVPSVFGRGGPSSGPHHRRTVEWLAANVPDATLYEIANAQHGAHLSHPDHFAAMTRLVVEKAGPGARTSDRPASGRVGSADQAG
jgi:pimeloyl-ACP methyl ester carboxylesterase